MLPPDDATATSPVPADALFHRWSAPLCIGFRLAFCYLGLYCITNGNATFFEALPMIGGWIEEHLAKIFTLPAQYLAQHLFHIAPPGNAIHPTGSGDTAIEWISVLLTLAVSVLATLVWSFLDRRRPHYQTLAAWLRFTIRLTLGFGMVVYGLVKLFPLQMPSPSLASLSEPLGMHSPMALLWNFIGANPVYESICGGAEILAGVLILFRRTALLGSLLTAFVTTNILLYNLCFDVPVKLYAGHLLLLATFVVLPDAAALFCFFWLHQNARPTGVWVPPANRPWFRRATIAVEIVFAVLTLAGGVYMARGQWLERRAAYAAPSPLRGAWHIESATRDHQPHPVYPSASAPPKDQRPFVDLNIDLPTRLSFRTDASVNVPFTTKIDSTQHTLQLIRDDKSTFTYTYAQPDSTHLVLTPIGPDAATGSTLALSLVSPPEGYPLLHRGFHWVSEYPYQR